MTIDFSSFGTRVDDEKDQALDFSGAGTPVDLSFGGERVGGKQDLRSDVTPSEGRSADFAAADPRRVDRQSDSLIDRVGRALPKPVDPLGIGRSAERPQSEGRSATPMGKDDPRLVRETPNAGAGRGSVNPPMAWEPQPQPQQRSTSEPGFLDRLSKEPQYLGAAIERGWNGLRMAINGQKMAEYGELLETFSKAYTPEQIAADPKLQAEKQAREEGFAKLAQENAQLKAQSESILRSDRTRPETRQMFGPDKSGRGWLDSAAAIGGAIIKDPGSVVDLALSSGPSTLASAAASVLTFMGTKNPRLAAAAGGAGSGYLEFGNEYAENRADGMSHDEAWKAAATKSGVVGVLDAVSMHSAGKALDTIAQAIKSGATKTAIKDVAKETGRQAALGAGGEAGGSLAAGKDIDPTSVLLEAVGETVSAPIEAVSTRGRLAKEITPEAQLARAMEQDTAAAQWTTPADVIARDRLDPGALRPDTIRPQDSVRQAADVGPSAPVKTPGQAADPARTRMLELESVERGAASITYDTADGQPVTMPIEQGRTLTEQERTELADLRLHTATPVSFTEPDSATAQAGLTPIVVPFSDETPALQAQQQADLDRAAANSSDSKDKTKGAAKDAAATAQAKTRPTSMAEPLPALAPVSAAAVAPRMPAVDNTTEARSAPQGLRYQLTERPAYEDVPTLSLDDAAFEVEVLAERAKRGRLTPEVFAQSEIAKRLDTASVMQINDGLRSDPVATVAQLRDALAPAAATEVQPTAAPAAPITAPDGRPFSTPQTATVYAQQAEIKDYTIEPAGSGFVILADQAPATVKAPDSPAAASATTADPGQPNGGAGVQWAQSSDAGAPEQQTTGQQPIAAPQADGPVQTGASRATQPQTAPAPAQSAPTSAQALPTLSAPDGKPFTTKAVASLYGKRMKLQGYEPIKVDGGWVLEPVQKRLSAGISNPQALSNEQEAAIIARAAAPTQPTAIETTPVTSPEQADAAAIDAAQVQAPTQSPASAPQAASRMVSLNPRGKPFATDKSAGLFARSAGLQNPKVIPVDGGFAIEHDALAPTGRPILRLNPMREPSAQATAAATTAIETAQTTGVTFRLAPTAPRSHIAQIQTKLAAEGVQITPVPQTQWTQDQKIASEFARAMGRTLTVYEGSSADPASIPNGFVETYGSKHIYLDRRASDAPISVVAHEVLHSLPDAQRKTLERELVRYFRQDKRDEFLSAFGYKPRDFESEAAAFMAQALTKHPEFWTELQQRISNADFIAIAKLILAKLDQLMTAYPTGMAGRFEDAFITDVKAAREVLAKAYAEAINQQQAQAATPSASTSQAVVKSSKGEGGSSSDHTPDGAVFTVQGSRRSLDGFKTAGDAHMAAERTRRIRPDLDFRVEQKPSGLYMLAGYPKQQEQTQQAEQTPRQAATLEQTDTEQPKGKAPAQEASAEEPSIKREQPKQEAGSAAESANEIGKDGDADNGEQPFVASALAQKRTRLDGTAAPESEVAGVIASAKPVSDGAGFAGQRQPITLQQWTKANQYRSDLQDRFLRVLQVQQAVEAAIGETLPESQNVYLAETLSYGRAQARQDNFKEQAVKPFLEAVHKGGLTLDDVALYSYAMHAPERNAYLKKRGVIDGSGMTDKQAKEITKAFEEAGKLDALKDVHAQLMAINQATRDLQLAEGLITRGQYDAWSRMFKNYVPLKGLVSQDIDAIAGSLVESETTQRSTGWEVSGPQSLPALGRKTQASQIVEQSIVNYSRATQQAVKNSIGKALAALAHANPEPTLWEFVSEPGADTYTVKMQGSDIHIKIKDAQLLKALKQEGGELDPAYAAPVETLGKWTRYSGQILTRYNPVFGVVNAGRDTLWAGSVAFAELGAEGAARYTKNIAAEWKQDGPLWEEFVSSGALTGGFHMQDATKVGEELQAMLDWQGQGGPRRTASKTFDRTLWALEWIGQYGENKVRFALYKTAREMGHSVAKSAAISKSSTNFNRRGNWAKTMGAGWMFFNAGVQGIHSFARLLDNRRFQYFIAGSVALSAAIAMMNATVGGDDDDGIPLYDKIPDWEKRANLIIMLPPGLEINKATGRVGKSGRYIKIPLAHQLGFLWTAGASTSDLVRHAANPRHGVGAAKAGANIAASFFAAFNPIGGAMDITNPDDILISASPTIASQALQLAKGKNAFGNDVAPESKFDKAKPNSEKVSVAKYGSISHDLARWLNDATGGNKASSGWMDVTPGALVQVAGLATGGVGTTAAGTIELAMSLAGVGPEISAHKAVLAGRFFGRVTQDADVGRFYETREKIEALAEQRKRSIKERVQQDWTPQERTMLQLGDAAEAAARDMGSVNNRIRKLMDDPNIPAKEKQIKREELLARRAAIAERFNTHVERRMRPQD